ncbi:FRG domain-containing protein [Bacillus cereus]|uniref:FRG domain-containing protein n=1 Tax=Bacillaceae TaxID=186817 RepID=UPI000BF93997|nr:FRG domain-containing protein [Bacillus cereus]MDA2434510.1 FRG domain-containing protein [Bacillus cereus]MDA2650470.1 FRG domain-containing protein [Bacillus cereus]MDZ4545243.1 FRG domain-containing protein [Bacillus cereus]MDZ4604082.1 FRG domain-containing protein [Bacillus cereus]PEV23167.1 FRG domain-containing protein [Bacillus cereus]
MTNTERYSKRQLGNLPTPEEIIVKDLADYIKVFSDGNFTDCFFRGEPTNYNETISSALRDEVSNTGFNQQTKVQNGYSFLNMKEEFKREVWYKLSPDERMHFSAFSQHHGIPTNLIDITTSPLVALYFACQDYKNPDNIEENWFDEKRGFVYLFENAFVDITDIITKYEDENILELFAYDQKNIFNDMYNLFVKFESKHPFSFYKYFSNLIKEYNDQFGILDDDIVPQDIAPYNNEEYKIITWDYTCKIIEDNPALSTYIENGPYSSAVFSYTAYLQMFLRRSIELAAPTWWFDIIMPNFKYAPILTFERGRNQQGLFIYQTYLKYSEQTYQTSILSLQRVWPNKVLVIENKEKILKELDFMRINEKFIYGDYDNIASYIKRKFR